MSAELKESCAERLRQALAARKMRQADLCQRTGIPKSAISQYLSGAFEPKQDRVAILARALNVQEAWLMGFDVPMEREDAAEAAPNVTSEESALLERFRALPPEKQRLLLSLAQELQ